MSPSPKYLFYILSHLCKGQLCSTFSYLKHCRGGFDSSLHITPYIQLRKKCFHLTFKIDPKCEITAHYLSASTFAHPTITSPGLWHLHPLLPSVYSPHRMITSHLTLLKPSNGSHFTHNKTLTPYNYLRSSTWSEMPAPAHVISPKSYPITLSVALSSPATLPPQGLFLAGLCLERPWLPLLSPETMFKRSLLRCLA